MLVSLPLLLVPYFLIWLVSAMMISSVLLGMAQWLVIGAPVLWCHPRRGGQSEDMPGLAVGAT